MTQIFKPVVPSVVSRVTAAVTSTRQDMNLQALQDKHQGLTLSQLQHVRMLHT